MKRIFLVDGDNNIGTGLKGIEMLAEEDSVLVFYKKGLSPAKMKTLCAGSRADVQFVESVRNGKNALDFQIITELGVLAGRRVADYAYVISQDKGYSASIAALQTRYTDVFQEVALRSSIEECLKMVFLLRADSAPALREALIQECGSAQGELLYRHLSALLAAPAPAPAEVPVPAPEGSVAAVKRATHRGGRGNRRKKAAAKPDGATAAKPDGSSAT